MAAEPRDVAGMEGADRSKQGWRLVAVEWRGAALQLKEAVNSPRRGRRKRIREALARISGLDEISLKDLKEQFQAFEPVEAMGALWRTQQGT